MKPHNFDVLGTCGFSVLSVNPSDQTAHIRITAQAQPNNLLGYANNVYTQVTCTVFDANVNEGGRSSAVTTSAPLDSSS